MRKCRFCDKQIKDSSVVCEHCGRELIPGRGQSDQSTRPMVVTTGDIKREYEVIGPVYFQVSNKGIFSSSLSKLVSKYSTDIAEAKRQGKLAQPDRTGDSFTASGAWARATLRKRSLSLFRN